MSDDGPREFRTWLVDLDGALMCEERVVPGAGGFILWLLDRDTPFLVLTNSSLVFRRDVAARLRAGGLDAGEETGLYLGSGDSTLGGRPTSRRLGIS